MKKVGIIALGVCALLAAAGAYAMSLSVSGTWRYKMTVTVETPEGLRAGSAVRELSNSAPVVKLIDLPAATNSADVKGEAVVVDLGARGKLFALLKGYRLGEDHAELVFYQYLGGGTSLQGIRALNNIKSTVSQKRVMEPGDYPVLVMFKDSNDPKTVTPVIEMKQDEKSPFEQIVTADHFEELFGAGVRLKEITIEMTDEKVTWSIGRYLPWLDALNGGYLHGGYTGRDAPLGLYGGNFKTGENK